MDRAVLGNRFLESTRGQIVSLLRRGPATVDQLAAALGLTDNAIRGHLAALERDALVRSAGVQRTPGAGKPAVLFEVHPDALPLFSRAYPPALTTLVEVLSDQLSPDAMESALREVGRRLAAKSGGAARGSVDARIQAAARLLIELGGDVTVSAEENSRTLRSTGCPLSATVASRPATCLAVETLVSEVTGAPARSCCEHGAAPRCCFVIDGDNAA